MQNRKRTKKKKSVQPKASNVKVWDTFNSLLHGIIQSSLVCAVEQSFQAAEGELLVALAECGARPPIG